MTATGLGLRISGQLLRRLLRNYFCKDFISQFRQARMDCARCMA